MNILFDIKKTLLIVGIVFSPCLLMSLPVQAHPGNVSSDGAHFCRTNCGYYGYTYGERICHYPSDGCGNENIRQDSYEGDTGPQGPSQEEQGTTNGALHAREKDAERIKSRASGEGNIDGRDNGIGSSSAGKTPNSSLICSVPVTFTSPQPEAYTAAFQSSYEGACEPIYDDAYNIAYDAGYTAAAQEKAQQLATAPVTPETPAVIETSLAKTSRPGYYGLSEIAAVGIVLYAAGALAWTRKDTGKWLKDHLDTWYKS